MVYQDLYAPGELPLESASRQMTPSLQTNPVFSRTLWQQATHGSDEARLLQTIVQASPARVSKHQLVLV
jgi:hypothetical protein